jgi:monoamine oxidase
VLRCAGGNDQLAASFAQSLGERVRTRAVVQAISLEDDRARVTLTTGEVLECDEVVLAVPPSAWSRIAISPNLPEALAGNIQMGINVKQLARVSRRFWRDSGLEAYGLTDSFATHTWDALDNARDDNQPNDTNEETCLTAFSGGPAAQAARAMGKQDVRNAAYRDLMDSLYPGYTKHVIETRFVDWPSMPFIAAGYSFPAPGQVTRAGPILHTPHPHRLHFTGEHTCYRFVGYMEGALQSGVGVARRIST